MLRPHFRYTLAINARAYASLINSGGIIDQTFGIGTQGTSELFVAASKIFSVDWTNIEESIKRRKVEDIPGYYYRDDGLLVFRAMKNYVTKVVNYFYHTDKEVESDEELQAWADEIYTTAFPGYFEAKQGHGFPETIVTRDELIKRCTVIMFTGSAQHASVNFGQYAMYGFIPNAPVTLRRPPPTKKGVLTYKHLMDTLPDINTAKTSITIVYLLSQYSPDEVRVSSAQN